MERKLQFKTSLFIIPSFIGVATFYLAPFAVVIYYAFIDNIISREFVGFDNFKLLLNNKAFQDALKHTGSFSLMVVPLAIIVPLFFAILLMKKVPMQSTFRTILISPLMVPVASVILIWNILFHLNGTVNDFLSNIGLSPIDWFKSDHSQEVIIMLYMWKNIGYNMILFMSALAAIPNGVVEAAKLDGANKFRMFFSVKMPYLFSSIFFVGILSLINSFKIFREVYLLTGSYPYNKLYMVQHYMNNTFKNLDYQKLSCAAIIMCLILIVIIGALFFVDEKLGKDVEE